MRKRISEMTPADKASFLEATKRALLIEQGVPWGIIEPKIQAEIDATFDDTQFVRMDPDSGIDAAYARKEFGDKKPKVILEAQLFLVEAPLKTAFYKNWLSIQWNMGLN